MDCRRFGAVLLGIPLVVLNDDMPAASASGRLLIPWEGIV